MTRKVVVGLVLAFGLVGASCADDSPAEGEGRLCGAGELLDFEGETFCIVIEEGFLVDDCPEAFPEGRAFDEVIVCGEEEPPDEIEDELVEQGFIERGACPDPDDPDVVYASEDRGECELIDLDCREFERGFSDECGCGCIGRLNEADPVCEDPQDPLVEVIGMSPEECMRIDFLCEEGFEAFEDECGCGCKAVCPDPDDPRVTYAGMSNEDCADIFFTCEEGELQFGNICGCGCIAP